MKLLLHLEDSLYNSALVVRDSRGLRAYELTVRYDGTDGEDLAAYFLPRDPLLPGPAHVTYAGDTLVIEVMGDICELTVTPTCIPEFLRDAQALRGEGFWENLACRAIGKLAEVVYTSLFLRVGCTYRIPLCARIGTGEEVLRLRLSSRFVRRGWLVTEEVLEAMPVYVYFYEVAEGDRPFVPVDVRPANRAEVVRTARRVSLMQGVWHYPFTVGRTKRLTRRTSLRRKLGRLYRLSPARRQARFARDMEDSGGM